MKKFTKTTMLFATFFGMVILTYANSGSEIKETFEVLSTKLDKAIEQRNFHVAREAIEELLPLMKEEIKKDKKTLASLKKTNEPEIDPEAFEIKLNRKSELFESLKASVDISPAALRVKSEEIKKEVDEFVRLS
ncbi:MAG: hypothetical protein ACJAVY_001878 [Marinoscillum sp.]|jgi:hypothetical protein